MYMTLKTNEGTNHKNSGGMEDFEALLEAAAEKEKKLKQGEVVPGRVVRVTEEHALVDVSFKAEGLVDINEFDKDEKGLPMVQPGDELLVYIESLEGPDGYLELSKNQADRLKIWDEVAEVFAQGAIVEGTVVDKVRGGLVVDIGVKAFLPGSQIGLLPSKDLDSFLDQTLRCKVIKFNKKRGNVVLSRRVVLEEERSHLKAVTLNNIEEGQIVDGIVKNVTDYGVFVDLGGIDGLLHVTDISWGRSENPQKTFRVGDPIRVQILKYDREKQRVSLGLKQMTQDPWMNVSEKFPPGSVVEGKVMSITNYGAFVSLEDGVEGLIHVSEMSWNKKVKHPNKLLKPEDVVKAKVLEVDIDNKKISLGMKQLEPNPWEALIYKYPVGSTVKGTVSNITDFGIFVTVEDGVDGLVHVSDLAWSGKVKNPAELFQRGAEVEAKVLHIDVENEKFSLGIKQLSQDPWERAERQLQPGTRIKGKIVRITDFGAFVEVAPEVEGLIHISEISDEKVEDIRSYIQEGQEVEVEVTNIDTRERKLSLSMRALKRREHQADMKRYLDSGETLSSSLADAFKKTQ